MGQWFRNFLEKLGELAACCISAKLLIFFVALLLLLYVIFCPSFLVALALICLFFWLVLF